MLLEQLSTEKNLSNDTLLKKVEAVVLEMIDSETQEELNAHEKSINLSQ